MRVGVPRLELGLFCMLQRADALSQKRATVLTNTSASPGVATFHSCSHSCDLPGIAGAHILCFRREGPGPQAYLAQGPAQEAGTGGG